MHLRQRIKPLAVMGAAIREGRPLGIVLARIAIVPPLPQAGVGLGCFAQVHKGLRVHLGQNSHRLRILHEEARRPEGKAGSAELGDPATPLVLTEQTHQFSEPEAQSRTQCDATEHGKTVSKLDAGQPQHKERQKKEELRPPQNRKAISCEAQHKKNPVSGHPLGNLPPRQILGLPNALGDSRELQHTGIGGNLRMTDLGVRRDHANITQDHLGQACPIHHCDGRQSKSNGSPCAIKNLGSKAKQSRKYQGDCPPEPAAKNRGIDQKQPGPNMPPPIFWRQHKGQKNSHTKYCQKQTSTLRIERHVQCAQKSCQQGNSGIKSVVARFYGCLRPPRCSRL